MKTIRRNVFETNSSTTHCITISKQYKSLTDIPYRKASEFPKLNENNELEVELNIFWDMEVLGDTSIDLNSVDVIIKYLCSHAVFSSQETLFSRRNHETRDNFDKNHAEFLKDIQDAYKIMELPIPVDVKPFVYDINDKKVYITKDNLYKWFLPYDVNSWFSTKKAWQADINKKIKKNSEAKNWPYIKYNIGLCGNDLCHDSYESATSYYTDFTYGYDSWDKETVKDITTIDLLTKQMSLSFYHS